MAKVLIQEDKRRLLASTPNMAEKMELMKLPSRRWMQQANMFSIPLNRASATAMLDAANAGKLGLAPEVITRLEDAKKLRVYDREFPKWYVHKGPQPFAKQREGSTKVYRVDTGALLCEMGTGKTKMVMDILSAHFMERRIDVVIVLCPNTVKSVWPIQIAEHCPIPSILHDGDSKFDFSKVVPSQKELNWVITGTESLSQGRAYEKLLPLTRCTRYAMVVDESHDIKNGNSIRTKRAIEIGKEAKLRYILTGTPILKNLIDYYSQFEFLDPNIIGVGDYYAFRNRYAIMGGYKQKEIVGYNHVEELMGLIEPYTFQCLKKEVLDLPEKLYTERVIELTEEQRKLYDKVKKAELGEVSVAHVLTRILRLHQITGGFLKEDDKPLMLNGKPVLNDRGKMMKVPGKDIPVVAVDRNPKIKALLDICTEHDKQIIVWATHLPEIDAIVQVLEKLGPTVAITGATSDAERAEYVAGFQSGKYKYFVGTQMAGGVGTTLTAAQVVVYYSNSYSLKDRLQSEDRAHRIGQRNPVLYIDLTAKRTVDLIIQRAILEKKDLSEYVKGVLGAQMSVTKLLEQL